ncbi:MAG: hypothetical protein K1X83_04295 [Oligoflexia bacterium]|nr:hypothetical protein [Oligoflexia bacterium]
MSDLTPAGPNRSLLPGAPLGRLELGAAATERLTFSNLAGRSIEELYQRPLEELAAAERDQIRTLREIIDLDRAVMQELNQHSPGIPLDDVEKLVGFLTASSSSSRILRSTVEDPQVPGRYPIIGWGLLFTDPDQFPNREEIPESLLNLPHLARVARLFVSADGRASYPNGEAFTALIDGIKADAQDGPIVGMVLVGPDDIGPQWLEAKNALERRDFGDLGIAHSELFSHPDGRVARVDFRLYLSPSPDISAHQRYQQQRASLNELKVWERGQMALGLAYLPADRATIAVLSGDDHAYKLAGLMPGNTIIAVELNPDSKQAERRGQRQNLLRVPAQLLSALLQPESLDGAMLFSCFPDLAREGQFDYQGTIEECCALVSQALKPGAILAVRDTVAPLDRESLRTLELDSSHGAFFGDTKSLNTAALFVRFQNEAKQQPWFTEEELKVEGPVPGTSGTHRFKTSARMADEFLLKLPYLRTDFVHEMRRLFTPHTAKERDALLESLGLRRQLSAAEFNRWIKQNIWEKQARLLDEAGNPVEYPATNHFSLYTKVREGDGVKVLLEEDQIEPHPRFLTPRSYQHQNGKTVEIMERAAGTLTADIIPYWITNDGQLRVLAHVGAPRPLVLCSTADPDAVQFGPYVMQQFAAIIGNSPTASAAEIRQAEEALLRERAGIDPLNAAFEEPTLYFSHPNMPEAIRATAVRIREPSAPLTPAGNFSGLHSAGFGQVVSSASILMGAQRDGLQDPRLERKVYELHLENHLALPPWLGDPIALAPQQHTVPPANLERLFERSPGRTYTAAESKPFWEVRSCAATELNQFDERLGSRRLERFTPRPETGFGDNLFACLPVMLSRSASGEVIPMVGIDHVDSIATQLTLGQQKIVSAPTFLTPKAAVTLEHKERFVAERLSEIYDLEPLQFFSLGGDFFVTLGTTAARVHCALVPVQSPSKNLAWVPLSTLVQHARLIQDGQLLTLAFRSAHALGVI